MRVLMITCEWPTPDNPHGVPFIVRQVEFLRKAGVDIDVFFFRGAKNPANYLRAWLEVRKKLRQNSYDLIHAQWGQSGPIALPTRLPLVVTFRGGEGEGLIDINGKCTPLGHVLRAVGQWMSRRADELVMVSSHMQQFFPNRTFDVIPSGLDFSKLPLIPQDEARRQLGLHASKPLVLFVGNPADQWKRYALARDVFSRLDKSLDAEFVLAWGVPHNRVPVYMNACDAMLFTSFYEGSPNVIKEALACNLPIVSVPVGDVPVRLSGVSGCAVCPDTDPDQMAATLSGILKNKARTNGRDAVRELDENVLSQRMIGIYQRAMAKKGSFAPQDKTNAISAGA